MSEPFLGQEGGLRLRHGRRVLWPSTAPLITVAIVTFNAAATLEAALAAVFGQRYPNVELVVVDGASTDRTVDILRANEQRIDYWVSERDSGIYNAMNKARGLASGDWLLFVGADDVLLDSLADIAERLQDAGTTYYGDVLLASNGRRYAGRLSRYRLMQQNICHQCIFYPRQVYARHAYDEELKLLADHKYNIELATIGSRLVHLPIVVCRFNDAGASSRGEAAFYRQQPALIKANFGMGYYLLKRLRNTVVRVTKGRTESD